MPLFTWATFATALMNMIATVALSAAVGALFLEHVFNVPFYDATRGGSAVLYEHMFWFYSHPAVYIFIIPRSAWSPKCCRPSRANRSSATR